MTRGPQWLSRPKLMRHFRKHAHEFGFTQVGDYENSALDTIGKGRRFTYVDNQTGLPRVGYFEPATGRFTGLTITEASIVTHFITTEHYVRNELQSSTYQ